MVNLIIIKNLNILNTVGCLIYKYDDAPKKP